MPISPRAGQRELAAPEEVVRQLEAARLLERRHAHALRVEPAHHVLDRAVLAGRVHRLEDDQQRPPALGVQALLQRVEALDVLRAAPGRRLLVGPGRVVGVVLRQLEAVGPHTEAPLVIHTRTIRRVRSGGRRPRYRAIARCGAVAADVASRHGRRASCRHVERGLQCSPPVDSSLATRTSRRRSRCSSPSAAAHTPRPRSRPGAWERRSFKKNAVVRAKVKNNAINGSKVATDSLTGADVKESTFDKVPAAALADGATHANSAAAVDKITYKSATGTAPRRGAGGSATATCDPGQHVVGGGLRVDDPVNADLLDDYPDASNTAWTGRAYAGSAAVNFTVYAVCTTAGATG